MADDYSYVICLKLLSLEFLHGLSMQPMTLWRQSISFKKKHLVLKLAPFGINGHEKKLIRQVADLEYTLTTINFPRHGCIYFKEDLRSLTGDTEDLIIDSALEANRRFSIGPLTSAELWTGTRKDMELDRGPCEWTGLVFASQIISIATRAQGETHASTQKH